MIKLNQYVVFKIGKEFYSVNIEHVEKIENDKKIRPMPNTSEEIKGIFDFQGKYIVPVVDLRIKFNIASGKIDEVPFIIVCKVEENVVGFVVDEVIEVIEIPSNKISFENINEAITGEATEYIQGIHRKESENDKGEQNEDLLVVLNVNKLLGAEKLEEIKQISDEI